MVFILAVALQTIFSLLGNFLRNLGSRHKMFKKAYCRVPDEQLIGCVASGQRLVLYINLLPCLLQVGQYIAAVLKLFCGAFGEVC